MKHTSLFAALTMSLLLIGAGCAQKSPNADGSKGAAVGPSGEGPGAAVPANAPGQAGGTNTAPATAPRTAVVALKMIGSSGQSGSATLIDLAGNNTRIDITLTGKDTDKSQTAAIFAGTCATAASQTQYPLNPVVNGKSSTTLNVNIGALIDKVPQAIKIKQDSVNAAASYAACGELR